MCGIYITNLPYDKPDILNKLKKISYRGPDNLGFNVIDDISISHLRLSILDLEKRSNQPFVYENLAITFNGEIYNYLQIRKELLDLGYSFKTESDTEVLLIGYFVWKEEILQKINGMFSFSIYDFENKIIFSARDRLGVKPFYYYWDGSNFEICSQISPLLNKSSIISSLGISIYLDCGYVPSPHTIIENIYKLEPGNFMKIDLNHKSLKVFNYWDLKKTSISKESYSTIKNKLHNLLVDSVKIRLQSDVPIGSFLSGGVDSALISAIASKHFGSKLNTFTIKFNDPKFDESLIADAYSKIISSNHKEILFDKDALIAMIPSLVKAFDEPFADSSALPSLLLNKTTKNHVTVALSGDGGDESFIGYNNFDAVKKFKKLSILNYSARKYFILKLKVFSKYLPIHFQNAFLIKDLKTFIIKIFIGNKTLLINRDLKWLSKYDKYFALSDNVFQNTADFNIKLWLENDSNVKVDRASMYSSVEVRSPFLDYRIVEYARNIPMKFKFHKNIRKIILKDILKEYIPEDVFNQPKKGFSIPLKNWLSNELKDDILKMLSNDFLNKVPNLNVDLFKRQLKLHLEQGEDYSKNIWKLYVLSKWYEKHGF